ncbi:hypothetical protein GCM10009677_28350 [Sphaerisporangium rubeum]|uniref:Outer membrane murein-binding lipoprotein Lpp n=1 Tax=Sphaerisporangium rubeum TaxID=321317 RepID=A0A7X0IE98_9ACTN|nr:hypothetical protein [Sphaerisporangium rubeum]MBB6472944.1 outer membrane murein-binding lipoprotein Lpp [Sphaerisporangium rubeum]
MRFLPRAAFAVSAVAAVVLVTGCSSLDKAQGCIEANKVISDTAAKVGSLVNDPEAMEKALRDGATKLEDVADKAGNTTLNEALQKLADSIGKLDVNNAADAAQAAQKVATDAAQALRTVAEECT